jgi:hypothetical protein
MRATRYALRRHDDGNLVCEMARHEDVLAEHCGMCDRSDVVFVRVVPGTVAQARGELTGEIASLLSPDAWLGAEGLIVAALHHMSYRCEAWGYATR